MIHANAIGCTMNAINQTSPIEEALEYLASGWSIIPIVSTGQKKEPAVKWKKYQSEHADEATARSWWDADPRRNIGIVTGEISGLIVLDVDGPEGLATLETFGELPRTPVVRTGKGKHYYFRYPGVKVRNFTKKLPGLDFRGDGGYVVAPPSKHVRDSRNNINYSSGGPKYFAISAGIIGKLSRLRLRDKRRDAIPLLRSSIIIGGSL